jgi:hypothetical protein
MEIGVEEELRAELIACDDTRLLLELLFAAYENALFALTLKFWTWLVTILRDTDIALLHAAASTHSNSPFAITARERIRAAARRRQRRRRHLRAAFHSADSRSTSSRGTDHDPDLVRVSNHANNDHDDDDDDDDEFYDVDEISIDDIVDNNHNNNSNNNSNNNNSNNDDDVTKFNNDDDAIASDDENDNDHDDDDDAVDVDEALQNVFGDDAYSAVHSLSFDRDSESVLTTYIAIEPNTSSSESWSSFHSLPSK